jgi:hypothetical protein
MRLTDQAATLKTLVNSLGRGLNEHPRGARLGMAHDFAAWSVCSSKVIRCPDNNKIAVLMTDGAHTWSADGSAAINESYNSAYGYYTNASSRLPRGYTNVASNTQARAAIDQLTRETCANARNSGVTIYTIGFSVVSDPIDAQGLQLLRDCAGAADRSFVAANGNELMSVFHRWNRPAEALKVASWVIEHLSSTLVPSIEIHQ